MLKLRPDLTGVVSICYNAYYKGMGKDIGNLDTHGVGNEDAR